MKVIYAFRRAKFYPYTGADFLFPPREVRPGWLRRIREIGFDGIELGIDAAIDGSTQQPSREVVAELRKELEDAGVPCLAVRGGGGYTNPRTAAASRQRLFDAIQIAAWIGATVVNTGITTPAVPGQPGAFVGEPVSQGGSRMAREEDFERTAKVLREAGQRAADHGLDVSIEVHQQSIADNSWSTLHLLDLVGLDNVGANPDLGNIYWTYEVPEETSEEAIVALAPRAKYWHCKNLVRVHIPENRHSIFLRVPLPDGDIDYRFAISAMVAAGYSGHLAIEGVREGDQLTKDAESLAYVRSILRELGQE